MCGGGGCISYGILILIYFFLHSPKYYTFPPQGRSRDIKGSDINMFVMDIVIKIEVPIEFNSLQKCQTYGNVIV